MAAWSHHLLRFSRRNFDWKVVVLAAAVVLYSTIGHALHRPMGDASMHGLALCLLLVAVGGVAVVPRAPARRPLGLRRRPVARPARLELAHGRALSRSTPAWLQRFQN